MGSCDERHWQDHTADANAKSGEPDFASLVTASPVTPPRDSLLAAVSRAHRLTPATVLNSRARGRVVPSARRILCHIARNEYGLAFSQIAGPLLLAEGTVRRLTSPTLSTEEQRHAASALCDLGA